MQKIIHSGCIIIALLLLCNCSDDVDDASPIALGIWISSDKTDTLDFISQNNFQKSNAFMRKDHFDYALLPNDSI
ncbi:hypothetical protein [Maribacter sp. 2307ULW6-5]|uniref:hypothetical protein n=1 Tax=Maribacter sp. 2307ULW6-5 TaxID=3386275 RepID=UPI0039BCC0B5